MPHRITQPLRVLIVDDDAAVQAAYRKILERESGTGGESAVDQLRAKLFPPAASDKATLNAPSPMRFALTVCSGAIEAVDAVRQSLADRQPFALAFLDMRMPPGPDGAWAAEEIRRLDADLQIILCTAYSDVDPAAIAQRVQPEDRLFYIEKPFHPHEVRQMASALCRRWHAERALTQLAYFDPLTGLPNRQLFRRRLSSVMQWAAEQSLTFGVLYLDLDNFKRINDTLGHSVGDDLLKVMAERLRGCLRAEDAHPNALDDPGNIARIGGDEFVILLPALSRSQDAEQVAARVIGALQEPVTLAEHQVVVTPSVGVALYPEDGQTVEALFRNSDLAMYFAKRERPGTHARYSAAMSADGLHRLTIETQLRGALERSEFSLQYQPQFDLATGHVSGMEALIRWNNPHLGRVSPVEFIPVAEETGLIISIGEWVLRTACAVAKTWNRGDQPIRIAVNVSALQFAQRNLPQLVTSVLSDVGLEPNLLELELTESVVMKDEEGAIKAIAALREIGVLVAIDDFGTGHSSLSRLRDLAVNRLKIDRSFVKHIVTRQSDFAVANAIIDVARSLGLSVVAEGVEDLAQLMCLKDQGCDHAQGFLMSAPLSEVDAGKLLARLQFEREASRTQRLQRVATLKTG